MTKSPAGVNPALWDEFEALAERVHDLHRKRRIEDAAPAPPSRRMAVDVPEEWFLLFAWIAKRERDRAHGHDGATMLTPDSIPAHRRTVRPLVAAYIRDTLNDHFHAALHDLATGASPLLRPPPAPAAPHAGDLDDGLPF